MQTLGNRPTLGGMVLQHIIVFLICVVFPGGVTLMAPATWLTFERNDEAVRCTTRTCVFFVVPFKVQRVDQVTEIDNENEPEESNGNASSAGPPMKPSTLTARVSYKSMALVSNGSR